MNVDHNETFSKSTDSEVSLTPGEVASLFHVAPGTVARWATCGLLSSFRTSGGHRRFPVQEVYSLVDRNLVSAKRLT